MKKYFYFSISSFLIVALSIVLMSSNCENGTTKKTNVSGVYTYGISGKSSNSAYKGEITIIVDDEKTGVITAYREVLLEGEKSKSLVGMGLLSDGRIQIKFGNSRVSDFKETSKKMVAKFMPGLVETIFITGTLDKSMKTAKITVEKKSKDARGERGSEIWKLKKRGDIFNTSISQIDLKKGEWTSIPITVDKAKMIKIESSVYGNPIGYFVRKGKKLPEITRKIEDDCVSYTNTNRSLKYGAPTIFDESKGVVWVKKFTEKDVGDWVFVYADSHVVATKVNLRLIWVDIGYFPRICDPWVDIEINPSQVAVGEPVNITVSARAFAGLDMLWWFGNGTGITELDKAHIISGNGNFFESQTWTITIDEPGTYSFGANSRDELYWTDHGTPHQASEGCGLAYDVVTVVPEVRKSYSTAFILLAPAGTDVSTADFQNQLNKIEDIKTAFTSQFVTSTEGHGIVDVSYPTVVLTPPGPIYGISDGNLMWNFLKQTLINDFYSVHPDAFDFLAIYEMYPGVSIGSRHLTTKTFVAGLGITPYDISASYGSAGNLRGIGLVADVTDLPDTYEFMSSKMHLLLHEVFGHQWGAYASRIKKPGSHFDVGIESPNFTVLYGRPWRKIDATHFTTEEVLDPATGTFLITFHPWMLYVAGMKMKNEVPQTLMDIEPDIPPASRYDLVTTTGTFENFTLQSVIDESGDRYDVIW